MSDVLKDLGPVFLGSRLKRLAERLQSGAARAIAAAGLDAQPAHMPLLAALDRGALTVGQLGEALGMSQPGVTRAAGQLIDLGLVQAMTGSDQRQRSLSLTPAGEAAMARAKLVLWPKVEQAVSALCAGLSGPLLDQITVLEQALAAQPLDERVAAIPPAALTLREFSDDLAPAFRAINAEWIEAMFSLEQTDRDVLDNPRARIIEPGGAILFVEAPGLGIVGACALQKTGEGRFELTKMGVRATARGLKVGEFLLAAMIGRAEAMGAEVLYLLTNKRCEAAIHLYEKLGFQHDAGIMRTYGARYARCDVAMKYHGLPSRLA
jgi:ribosomal protein S18 acetylase RimI-like enzyme/DNA-binding transcriptional ArsR family regulator